MQEMSKTNIVGANVQGTSEGKSLSKNYLVTIIALLVVSIAALVGSFAKLAMGDVAGADNMGSLILVLFCIYMGFGESRKKEHPAIYVLSSVNWVLLVAWTLMLVVCLIAA